MFLTGGTTDQASGSYVKNSGALVLSKPVRQSSFDKILADVSGA